MSEQEILNWLKIDTYKKVAEACETSPKSAKELSRIVGITEGGCAEILEKLEDIKALEFTSGGWKTTAITTKILKKFF